LPKLVGGQDVGLDNERFGRMGEAHC